MSTEEQVAPASSARDRITPRRRVRFAVMAGLVALLLVAGRDASIGSITSCLVLGHGRHYLSDDAKPFVADFFGYRYRGRTDEFIDASVYLFGAYERQGLALLRDALPKRGVFMDVGANTGHHVLFMARYAGRVHAVEPYPPVIKVMEQRLAENAIGNVTIHRVGLSDEPGELPFHPPDADNMGVGTFSEGMARTAATTSLPLVRGDTLVEDAGIQRIDVVKIDIEGYEKPALHGLEQTLRRDRPIVVLELNVDNAEGFHSEEDLRGSFPERYEFFEVPMWHVKWKLPGGELICGDPRMSYELVPYSMQFDETNINLAAIPHERLGQPADGGSPTLIVGPADRDTPANR